MRNREVKERRSARDWAAVLAAALLVVEAVVGAAGAGEASAQAADPPATPAEVGRARPVTQSVPVDAVRGLLYARPFRLREPYVYSFLAGQPAILRGSLLVLAVDPEVARPRDVDVPVLYGGDTPLHLTNTGYSSGRMVIIAPEWFDLANSPVFFGSMELPERVDRARGREEQALAIGRGAVPFASAERAAARAAGGDSLVCAGSVELFRAVADLIDRYAPDEKELADIYRTPLVEP